MKVLILRSEQADYKIRMEKCFSKNNILNRVAASGNVNIGWRIILPVYRRT